MTLKMNRIIKKIYWLTLVLVLLGGFLTPEDADARRQRRIVFEEGTEVRGKIIRPEMSLILQRSKINYDALKLKESFLPRIIRSVKQEPF